MQRAVAIALAGGLLAASAGAFGLAQVLKLERSPIEAITVDPTPNHGRGQLDRHDSALFSPLCSRPCTRAATVRFRVHTAGPVHAEIVAPGGQVVRDLGVLPHPGGKVVATWNGRDAAGQVAPAGSYRMQVRLSGRRIKLLNPLTLDTSVGVLGTSVTHRVFSPDCDTHVDRVTVVVRGSEQLAGLRLQVLQGTLEGTSLVRTVRLRQRARALAISYPPYAGKRCQTAEDARGLRLRVIARDVAGNARAIALGPVRARGVIITVPDRSIIAGKRLRVGLSTDAPSLRLDLTRLGGTPAVLVRGAHAPAVVARIPATAAGGVYIVSNRHAGRSYASFLAVRGAKPAHVALLVTGKPDDADLVYARRLDALGIPFDVLTTRDAAAGALEGYKVVIKPPGVGRTPEPGAKVIRDVSEIVAGLGQ